MKKFLFSMCLMATTTFAFANNNEINENELKVTKQELKIIDNNLVEEVTCSAKINGITYTVKGEGKTIEIAALDCTEKLLKIAKAIAETIDKD